MSVQILSYGFIPKEPVIVPRWQVSGYPLLVGGPVTSVADWQHLAALGIGHVISVTDPPDVGVPVENYTHVASVQDDGSTFAAEALFLVTNNAHEEFKRGKWVYLHCWLGRSRSPSFAYAVLRKVFAVPAKAALATVSSSCPHQWPRDRTQGAYIESIEAWLS